jgi:ABC-type sugar transport system ATPase subunit
MKILEMKDICKSFPGVVAVDHVSLTLEKGETLALIGENGAGKSTLMKILSGAYAADSGAIEIEGKTHTVYDTREAISLGIGIVYQELNYLNEMSIAENLYIGRIPVKGLFKAVDYKKLFADAKVILAEFGLSHLDPAMPIGRLAVAEKQLVEIARAFTRDVKILVMDEPTSALNDVETANLFNLIREIKAKGVSVIYISHRLNEVYEIADSVQVMRDGKNVTRLPSRETTIDTLVSLMVGREIRDMYPGRSVDVGEQIFEARGITTDFLKDVSLDVREGEVVGLFGLMGSGRGEIARCVIGQQPCTAGKMHISGKAYAPRTPLDALRSGVAYVPAERKGEGINAIAPVKDNITIANMKKAAPHGRINLKKEALIAQEWVDRLGIRTPGIMTAADSLSGGNQQKVVVAKGLNTEPRFMILNEPTRGIDVGAKVEIYNLINELCRNRKAVLMISSELPEIMSMSDRIFVVHEGKITAQLQKADFTQEILLKYAIGG